MNFFGRRRAFVSISVFLVVMVVISAGCAFLQIAGAEGDAACQVPVVPCLGGNALPGPPLGSIQGLTAYVEGEGELTYDWRYDNDEYSVSFDLPDELYAYYRDYPIQRYMATEGDRDNALNFITDNDSVVVYVAECMDDLSERVGLDDAEKAELVLVFVQEIPYEYDDETHSMGDYWSFPVEILHDWVGDCEDTSFLYSSLMAALGYETALLVFEDHIAVGVSGEEFDGWYYEIEGTRYYYCETTGTGWSIGEMPEEYDEAYVLPVGIRLGPPTDLEAEVGDSEATISWSPPNSDGGSPVDRYAIYLDGEFVAEVYGTTYTLTGLLNGLEYEVTIAAHNEEGYGPPAVLFIMPLAQGVLPEAPTALKMKVGDGAVTLTWSPPEDEGETAVDFYVVFLDGRKVALVENTTYTIRGLMNGEEYEVTVAAHNSAGVGPKAPAVVVIPAPDEVLPSWAIPLMLLILVTVIVIVCAVAVQTRRSRRMRAQMMQGTLQMGGDSAPPVPLPHQSQVEGVRSEQPQGAPDTGPVVEGASIAMGSSPAAVIAPEASGDAQVDGKGLEPPRFCAYCGSPLERDAVFCSNCGNRVR